MAWTVADDQEAFYRSQGWAGTRWDSPRDDADIYGTGSKARTDYFTDKLKEAAGDDGSLSYDEYVTALDNRPDKNMYNPDTKSNALARFGSSTGFTIDEDVMNQNALSYDGKDIIQKIDAAYTGPNRAYKDSVSYMRTEDDPHDSEGDSYNFWRWSAADLEEEDDPVDPVDPVEDCPDGQTRGLSGKCIDDKEYADNPWEETEKTPRELKDKREDWDANWDPTRNVDDPSELGSIPYWTPTMTSIAGSSTTYKPSITEGKFNRYISGNNYDHSKEQIESVLRAAGYRGNRSY